jgi:hypothetical protein
VAFLIIFPVYLAVVNSAVSGLSRQVLYKGSMIARPEWAWILGIVAGILWLLTSCFALGMSSSSVQLHINVTFQ